MWEDLESGTRYDSPMTIQPQSLCWKVDFKFYPIEVSLIYNVVLDQFLELDPGNLHFNQQLNWFLVEEILISPR